MNVCIFAMWEFIHNWSLQRNIYIYNWWIKNKYIWIIQASKWMYLFRWSQSYLTISHTNMQGDPTDLIIDYWSLILLHFFSKGSSYCIFRVQLHLPRSKLQDILQIIHQINKDYNKDINLSTCFRWLRNALSNSRLSLSHWSTICPALCNSSSWHQSRSMATYGNQTADIFFLFITSAGLCRRWIKSLGPVNQVHIEDGADRWMINVH